MVRPQHSVSRGQTLAIIRNETGVEMLFFIHDPARSGTGGQQSAIVDSSAAAQRVPFDWTILFNMLFIFILCLYFFNRNGFGWHRARNEA
jgi:hypothetical protein